VGQFDATQLAPVPVLTEEEFKEQFRRIASEGTGQELLAFVQQHRATALSKQSKLRLFHAVAFPFYGETNHSKETALSLLEALRVQLQANDILSLLTVTGWKENLSQLALRFAPSNDIVGEYRLLELFLEKLPPEGFLQFWEIHRSYFLDPIRLQMGAEYASVKLETWLKLRELGAPASIFNSPLSSSSFKTGSTLLQEFARLGEIETVRKIAADLPVDSLSAPLYEEELRDCLQPGTQVDLSPFDREGISIGQNGCRAVVFTPDGQVHSYPGKSAQELVKQLPSGTEMDSLKIYLNLGHASLAFNDSHIGFYPQENLEKNQIGFVEAFQQNLRNIPVLNTALNLLASSVGTMGSQSGASSSTNQKKSGSAVGIPLKKWGTANLRAQDPPLKCAVIDDSREKAISDSQHSLVLTVYAPKEKIDAVRRYVEETREKCKKGEESYRLYTSNCIDFVEKAVAAAWITPQFRNAFHSMQYLRRPGAATLYSLLVSKQPTLHRNSSHQATVPDRIDSVSRGTLLAPLAVGAAAFHIYLFVKALPKARACP